MENRVAHNRLDIAGHVYGHLTVIRFEKVNRIQKSVWLCQCVCGKEVFVAGNSLRSGTTKSCGCKNKGRLVQKHSEEKVCRVCRETLTAGVNFHLGQVSTKNWICKSCKSDKDAAIVAADPLKNYRQNLRAKYGIDYEEYKSMYEKQGGKCAICQSPAPLDSTKRERLFVDHSHETGEVRGLLCKNCNAGLGQFKDSKEFLQKAINYL